MVLVPREGKGGGLPRRQQFFRVLWVFFWVFLLLPVPPRIIFSASPSKYPPPPFFHCSLVFIGEVWLGHNLIPKHFLFFSFFSFFFLIFDFFYF
jgi:hypothetical protein